MECRLRSSVPRVTTNTTRPASPGISVCVVDRASNFNPPIRRQTFARCFLVLKAVSLVPSFDNRQFVPKTLHSPPFVGCKTTQQPHSYRHRCAPFLSRLVASSVECATPYRPLLLRKNGGENPGTGRWPSHLGHLRRHDCGRSGDWNTCVGRGPCQEPPESKDDGQAESILCGETGKGGEEDGNGSTGWADAEVVSFVAVESLDLARY